MNEITLTGFAIKNEDGNLEPLSFTENLFDPESNLAHEWITEDQLRKDPDLRRRFYVKVNCLRRRD
jgi:hypothetical protein